MGRTSAWARAATRGSACVLVAGLMVVTSAPAAHAHKPNVQTNLVRLDGGPNGFVSIRPTGGGSITLNLPAAPPGGTFAFDYRLNAGPKTTAAYLLEGDRSVWPLGFATNNQDKIEITDLRVLDAGAEVIAVEGTGAVPGRLTRYVVSVPLVWVVDTASDVAFTRGGDTLLDRNGKWSVGFDALRSRTTGGRLYNTANRAEIEISVNGGPWQVFTVSFDVFSGKSTPAGRPGRVLPIQPGDRVEVRRVDVFDAQGDKFATTGIRMGPQGHYAETVPPSSLFSNGRRRSSQNGVVALLTAFSRFSPSDDTHWHHH